MIGILMIPVFIIDVINLKIYEYSKKIKNLNGHSFDFILINIKLSKQKLYPLINNNIFMLLYIFLLSIKKVHLLNELVILIVKC